MEEDIKCPHCNSDNWSYIDTTDANINYIKGSNGALLELHKCDNCDKPFTVELQFTVSRLLYWAKLMVWRLSRIMDIILKVEPKYNGLENNHDVFNDNLNNCYTYAINQPLNPFTKERYNSWKQIQPGNLGDRKNGCAMNSMDYDNVLDYVKEDLNEIGYDIRESSLDEYIDVEGAWKIAYVYYSEDYHWYRQNKDGTWSHKRGASDVYYCDLSDNVIYDPKTCDRREYENFLGYYMIIPMAIEEQEEEVA